MLLKTFWEQYSMPCAWEVQHSGEPVAHVCVSICSVLPAAVVAAAVMAPVAMLCVCARRGLLAAVCCFRGGGLLHLYVLEGGAVGPASMACTLCPGVAVPPYPTSA
jgi:hypothetical protein